MNLIPPNLLIESFSPSAREFYPVLKEYLQKNRIADRKLSLKLRTEMEKLCQQGIFSTPIAAELCLSALQAAKESPVSFKEALRYVVIGVIMAAVTTKQQGEPFLEEVIFAIFNYLALVFSADDLGEFSKQLRRAKGQAFRFFNREHVPSFGDMRLGVGKGIGEGTYKTLEALPISEEKKVAILESSSIWDFYRGYYLDYLFNFFWP